MKKRFVITITLLAIAATSFAQYMGKKWDFDHDAAGTIVAGFSAATGSWKVHADATAPSRPNVLAQLAKSSRDAFNGTLVATSSYRDLDIRVKMRAVGGTVDQGGGIVWRAKDSRNYYAACYNPLQGSFQLYRVVNNGRVTLASVDIMNIPGWHTLRVVMTDDHIVCYFDGTKYLERRDATFREAGQIGLWTKADAQTYFDDVTITAKQSR